MLESLPGVIAKSYTMMRSEWLGSVLVLLVASFAGAEDATPKADAAKAAAAAQKKLLERFDTNKDGVLSDAEQLRAQEALKQQGALLGSGLVPGGFPSAAELLKRFDKNRDGKLTGDEKLAAQAAMQKPRGSGGPAAGALGGVGGGVQPGAAAAQPAAAEDKPERKPNPLIKLYDLDGDGKLNDEEKAALQADRGKKKAKEKAKAKKGD